jgi:hypothetical protein
MLKRFENCVPVTSHGARTQPRTGEDQWLERKIMTTDAGRPAGDNQNSLTVWPRGPVVFEDFLLFEKMAHGTGIAKGLGLNLDSIVGEPQVTAAD